MKIRKLGKKGLTVSALGYGSMVLGGFYGGIQEPEAVKTIRHALDVGITFIDTSDAYGVDTTSNWLGELLKTGEVR